MAFIDDVSMEMATTMNLSGGSAFCNRSSDGSSATQGVHHVAQRLTSTTLPLKSSSVIFLSDLS